MFGEYHSLCTLKTSIVDFGKEKEHCIRYKSQNVWFLLKSPHMPSFRVEQYPYHERRATLD
jgi:hypothetical protein